MAKPKEPEGNYYSLDPRQQRLFAATPAPPAVAVAVAEAPEAPKVAAGEGRAQGRRSPARRGVGVQSTIQEMLKRRTSA